MCSYVMATRSMLEYPEQWFNDCDSISLALAISTQALLTDWLPARQDIP